MSKIKTQKSFYQPIYCRKVQYSFVIFQHWSWYTMHSICWWLAVSTATHTRVSTCLHFYGFHWSHSCTCRLIYTEACCNS